MAPDLRDTLIPGFIAVRGLQTIDYVSTSMQSQNGRKISLHLSEPDFRDTHPAIDKPYATEYRPGKHAKLGDRKYFLSGADREGNVRLINFLCQSQPSGNDGSTITDIPQTGSLVLKGKSIFINGQEKVDMTAEDVIRVHTNGEVDTELSDNAEELMILGLEFDKMQSDTSMHNDSFAQQRFVTKPTEKSMNAIGDFTRTNPAAITNRLFGELAKYWSKVKPHKSR